MLVMMTLANFLPANRAETEKVSQVNRSLIEWPRYTGVSQIHCHLSLYTHHVHSCRHRPTYFSSVFCSGFKGMLHCVDCPPQLF